MRFNWSLVQLAIPFNFKVEDKIFNKNKILNKYEIFLSEFSQMFNSTQIYEGGFFVMIGKNKALGN